VEKKGHDVLIQALGRLPADLHWRWVHVGDGPLLPALKRQAEAAGLADRVAWLGARPQADVLAALRRADLFVLACRIGADGDRDGLPNVLLEAQSQALACVATAVSAIPEFIEDGRTGLLVPPDDAEGFAIAMARLIREPALRQRLGRAGLHRVHAAFAMDPGIDRLAAWFGLQQQPARCASPSTRH
jgi:glycosyltransferase involved in cell wall biosynthesis